MAYTLNTPLGTFLNDPKLITILERHFPNISKNPFLNIFLDMPLNLIISNHTHLGITKDKADAFLADVNQFTNG